jgi:hypothetical protein
MGDGRIFLKTGRDASFHKDLSNEPNLNLIHLAAWTVPLRDKSSFVELISVDCHFKPKRPEVIKL